MGEPSHRRRVLPHHPDLRRAHLHPDLSQLSDTEVIDEALRRVADESATWLRADLARHIATLLAPEQTAGAADLVARIDRLAAEGEARCIALGSERGTGVSCRRDGGPVSEAVTDRRLTTPAVLAQETELRDWIARNTTTLAATDDPQRAAIDAMASHERAVLVVGPAGTGKTTATAGAVERLRSQRRPVVALAPSGKAADVVASEAGCRAETLASFLTRY